ncbi:hypothetical protein NHF50_02250 [Flavobacterium sp. NRK F10]|uniref:Uncharacterized protein n=1 Tax=Flavobacterium sediminis TaxID=2201181 RepID=A0A2U8QRG0_9FLAO|nr:MULTISPECIES: DUF6686 family protein [Flavobacterium]AWM12740.1 hypothetical protein DI487_01870 [Flavobacterium sediminis]MCO6173861.1 hypothetical protein [Flavobacterium sp. NRK F10]
MCRNYILLNQTENGLLLFLKGCANYQLSYKNLNFSLTKEELKAFKNYLKKINIEYWETEYQNSIYPKKIPIPTLQKNFIILLDRIEIEELLRLLQKEYCSFLRFSDIKNTIIWN